MTVIDAGAHWGLYTLVAARRVRQVIAFEPSAPNRPLLRTNVRLSGLTNVEARPEAPSLILTVPGQGYRFRET